MKKLLFLTFCLVPALLKSQAFLSVQDTIYFANNSSDIDAEALKQLSALMDKVKGREVFKIDLTGHTDSKHDNDYNNRLALNRAEAVKKYFIEKDFNADMISVSAFGEEKPAAPNAKEAQRKLNRRVTISISYWHKLPMASRTGQGIPGYDATSSDWKLIRGEKGSLVFVKPTSFEEDFTNISFNVTEALDPCDMIRQNLNTVSTNGECLQSAGMLFLDIRDKSGKPVKPKAGETVQIWIPATNYDPTMEIYLPMEGMWKSTKLKPTFQQRENKSFYVIETTFASGWNLDRPICPCPANGPELKVKSPGKSKVYVSYAANNLTKLPSIEKNHFKLSKKVEKEDSTMVTVTVLHKNKIYMVHKPLSELSKRKNGQLYVVRRKDFIRKNPTDPNDPEKDLCELLGSR